MTNKPLKPSINLRKVSSNKRVKAINLDAPTVEFPTSENGENWISNGHVSVLDMSYPKQNEDLISSSEDEEDPVF